MSKRKQKYRTPREPSRVLHRKGRFVVLGNDGDTCPRCGKPTEIREHKEIGPRQLRQPFYYERWFNCLNPDCKTTLIMPPRFIVHNQPPEIGAEQLTPPADWL